MNVLIVGFGNFGNKYYNLIKKEYPSYRIYLLRHSKNSLKISDEYDICKIFYSIDEINLSEINFVIITTPSNYHVKIANYFIERDIHCLIQKPLDSCYENGLKLLDCNKCCIHVGYLLRYSKVYKCLSDYEKLIGRLLIVKVNVGQYLPDWREKDYRYCVSSHKNMGGGVLLELSHDINYLLGILKNHESFEIQSYTGKISNLQIDVEDSSIVILEVKHNCNKTLVSLNIDMIDFESNRTCKLIGENGTLIGDFVKNEVKFINKDRKETILFSDFKENLLKIELENFINNINEKNYDNESIKDSLKTLEIIDLIKNQTFDVIPPSST